MTTSSPTISLKGKIAFITGASKGIGVSIAELFAAAGADLALTARNEEELKQTAEAARKHGVKVWTKTAEMGDADDVKDLADAVLEKFGRVDILVNNAGIFEAHPVDEVSYEDWQHHWQRTLTVNLTGPANLCWHAVQHMRQSGGGRIVNVSSRGAFRGEPRCPAYGASKAGLNALTQSLAQQLAPLGIFVGAVAPGFVETDMASTVLEGPGGDAGRRQSPTSPELLRRWPAWSMALSPPVRRPYVEDVPRGQRGQRARR